MANKKNNIHEITIKIEGEEWQKALDKSFKKKVKNVTIKEVGDATAFLFSNLSSAITGEVIHVDNGFSAIGV